MADITQFGGTAAPTQQPRQDVVSSGPTAEYMQARIQVLTRHLIQHFGNILDVALDPPANDDDGVAPPPSLVDTANRQQIVNTSTMTMIRAAEELMVLTRTMKELWLFGGLDTLVKDQSEEEMVRRARVREDEAVVVKGMLEWLRKNGERIAKGGDTVAVEGQEDEEMESE